jgi:hypothetical protein
MITIELDDSANSPYGGCNYRVRAANGYLLGLFLRRKDGRDGWFLADKKGLAKLDDDGHPILCDRWEDMLPIASAQFPEVDSGISLAWPGL